MKCGSQIAVAVVGGYLLGRSRKTRLAALLALLAAGGKLPIDQRELLRHTPLGAPLDKLTGDLRSQLVDTGMAVAKKAASNRIDSLSDRLQQRAEAMRGPGVRKGGEPEETEEPWEEPARPERERREPARRGRERGEPARRERAREPEPDEASDEYDEYERDDYERDDYEGDEYEGDEYEGDEYEGDEYEGDEPEPEGDYRDEPEPEPERDYREERRPPARSARSQSPRRGPRREDDRPRRGRAPR
jgi:hypothetical protein